MKREDWTAEDCIAWLRMFDEDEPECRSAARCAEVLEAASVEIQRKDELISALLASASEQWIHDLFSDHRGQSSE